MFQRRPASRFWGARRKAEPQQERGSMLAADRASASDRQLLEEIYLLLHDVQRTLKAISDRHDL